MSNWASSVTVSYNYIYGDPIAMDNSEPASPAVPHALNHDSMVTVSLSDIQSNSEHTQPDWRNLHIPPTPVESTHEAERNHVKTDSFGPMALRDAARTTPTPVDEPPTPTWTENKTLDEETNDEVDWENLEKTEEQEPRGESSDEVGDWLAKSPIPCEADPGDFWYASRWLCF